MSDIVGLEDVTEQELRDGLDVAEELDSLLKEADWGGIDPYWIHCMAEGESSMLEDDEEARQGSYGSKSRMYDEYEYRTAARKLIVDLARRLRARWDKGAKDE